MTTFSLSMPKLLYKHMNKRIYPGILFTFGLLAALGTAIVAIVQSDIALATEQRAAQVATPLASHDFSQFGPFAQLFVMTLGISVGGIVWWAKVTQNSIASHRKRNDGLIRIIVNMNKEKDALILEKDKIIAKLNKHAELEES